MVYSDCNTCGGKFHWQWDEAFNKFGFKDGDAQIETWNVAAALEEAGYEIAIGQWGPHNTIIFSIKNNGIECIPNEKSRFILGYDNPRDYLPIEIIAALDEAFPQTSKYCPKT